MPERKRKPADGGIARVTRDMGVEAGGAGAHLVALLDRDLAERPAEADDDAGDAAVADDEIGAGADDHDRDVGRQIAQEIAEVVLVGRHEQNLRRSADAEPALRVERLVGEQAPAQFRHARLEIGNDVGEAHFLEHRIPIII